MAPSFYTLMGVPTAGFDPSHTFTTSWLLPPIALAALRLILAVYCFATTFTGWGWDGTHGKAYEIGQEFSYFTVLTYWGLSFYLLVAGIHTLVYSLKGRSWLERWPRPLQVLHSLFYSSIITYPFLVTIVFWAVLYSPPWFVVEEAAWSNISRHALNSVFAMLEVVLPSTNPPPWLQLVFLILILLLYLALAYLTYATEGFFVYGFLNYRTHSNGYVTAYCFGIFAGILVIFGLSWLLVWLRKRFTPRGKRSRKDLGGQGQTNRHSNGYDHDHGNRDAEMAIPK